MTVVSFIQKYGTMQLVSPTPQVYLQVTMSSTPKRVNQVTNNTYTTQTNTPQIYYKYTKKVQKIVTFLCL